MKFHQPHDPTFKKLESSLDLNKKRRSVKFNHLVAVESNGSSDTHSVGLQTKSGIMGQEESVA
jgi:hypothetical protein